jgi:hypothetical protein
MTTRRDPDLVIRAFVEDNRVELPDHVYDVVRGQIDHKRQRVVLGPWREEQMLRFATFAISAVAIVLVAVVGIQLLPRNGGIGGQPTQTPTLVPTPTLAATPTPAPSASPSQTPVEEPTGQLKPGVTYIAHPFGAPNDSMSFSFNVPSTYWEAVGDAGRTNGLLKLPNNDGVGLAFVLVTSLNGDPCHWSGTGDDLGMGSTNAELVTGLSNSDNFEAHVISEATIGGANGWKMLITMPSTLPADCDEGVYRIWNVAGGFDMYAQGPDNHWEASIINVAGTRVVIFFSYFDDTPADRLADLRSIVDGMLIPTP